MLQYEIDERMQELMHYRLTSELIYLEHHTGHDRYSPVKEFERRMNLLEADQKTASHLFERDAAIKSPHHKITEQFGTWSQQSFFNFYTLPPTKKRLEGFALSIHLPHDHQLTTSELFLHAIKAQHVCNEYSGIEHIPCTNTQNLADHILNAEKGYLPQFFKATEGMTPTQRLIFADNEMLAYKHPKKGATATPTPWTPLTVPLADIDHQRIKENITPQLYERVLFGK